MVHSCIFRSCFSVRWTSIKVSITNMTWVKREDFMFYVNLSLKVRSLIYRGRYRKDLKKVALRRAAAILRSQRPLPPNRKGAKKAASTKKSD